MANHKSAKKATRQTLKKNLYNKSRVSAIKTYIKKVLKAIELGSKQQANEMFMIAQSKIMQGVKKDVFKQNTASRKVSKLALKISKMA